MQRRNFIKNVGIASAGVVMGTSLLSNAFGRVPNLPTNWMWMHAKPEWTEDKWLSTLTQLKEANIEGLLLGGGKNMLEKVIPLAEKAGIEVHAWMWTLNRNGDEEAWKHPDWFAVSREGKSCHEHQPYVEYYKWTCPSKKEVREHIEAQVRELAQIEGLKGVHLDYVRYADVILPIALQPKYNLVQDKEYPEFDFCYCPTCQQKFKEEYGKDVMKLEDPTADADWRQYRYDSVTRLVNHLYKVTHEYDKLLSAAVFPQPDLARKICRQSWDDWSLDMIFPMLYQNFYSEELDWVKSSAKKGVKALDGKFPLYAGLFIPSIEATDFDEALKMAKKGGAKGVSVFDLNSMTTAHWDALKQRSVR
ncbi:hypothetical protein V6R21_26070 [Limibacter armeniacum]|uniref:hypothetical protein n=1 Tax=Limibacter armeniacum TaxID=466084 RepID=UPI002FE6A7D2